MTTIEDATSYQITLMPSALTVLDHRAGINPIVIEDEFDPYELADYYTTLAERCVGAANQSGVLSSAFYEANSDRKKLLNWFGRVEEVGFAQELATRLIENGDPAALAGRQIVKDGFYSQSWTLTDVAPFLHYWLTGNLIDRKFAHDLLADFVKGCVNHYGPDLGKIRAEKALVSRRLPLAALLAE